ncbi:MAG: xanthine dehydrogenase family protein molybdopterin-binding subunit [Litoreibacter sp.]|nr:xanthine dehydrogenase family protein molybdopterin-binding subunit [Litoreibacter sp.]
MWKIGRSQVRNEDLKLLRGQGSFTGDRRGDDTLEMVILRSPVAAGRLLSVDTEAARTMPGVVDILTASEQEEDGLGSVVPRLKHPGPDGSDMRIPDVKPLATDHVKYVGHPIAVIIARSKAMAEDAAEAIAVEYEDRDAVVDPLTALEPDAPRVWPELPDNLCFRVEKGDAAAVSQAFESAAHVVRKRLRVSRVTAVAMEPREAIASYDTAEGFRLDIGTQTPHRVASDLAPIIGVSPKDIRVVARDTGGSFGMKNSGFIEYALALWAARRAGYPVAWTASRNESFQSDAHARDQWADAALALDHKGRFLAVDVRITAGLGACMGPATTHPSVANVAGLAGVYLTPSIHVVVDGVFTNCQQVAPYRGAGRPEATYIIERLIDLAALKTGQDRVALRRKNMIPTEQMPYETPLGWIYDCGEFETVLDRALEAADWAGFAERKAVSEARGMLRGIGISNPIEIAGGPVRKPHPEYASVSVAPQGNARIVVGSCDSGQGHGTTFRQIVSDRLGLEASAIDFVYGDTGEVAQGTGTFGSRSLTAAGTALCEAMDATVEELKPQAAELIGCDDTASLEFADGVFTGPNGKTATYLEVVAAAKDVTEAEVNASAGWATFPNGCHICEVEVDPATGQVELKSYTVADDVGTVVNPLLVKGQIAGGVAQGLGQALMENIAYDESGQLLTASFMDYAMPRAADMTGFDILSHPVPTATNPIGVKGVGEAGTVGALAAGISAVVHALESRGITHINMPATPERVWRALQEADQ